MTREWQVTWGFYSDRECYRGPSTFLAGLNLARARRHGRGIDVGGSITSVWDLATYDADIDSQGDGRTEEEEDFLSACEDVGSRYKWRTDWNHSRNWKKKGWDKSLSSPAGGCGKNKP